RWLEGNLLVLLDGDGRVSGFRGTHRDITDRKLQHERIARLTRLLQMQSGINAAVVRIRDRDELLREACRLARHVGGYDHALISRVAPDGRTAVPWYWSDGDAADLVPQAFPISDGTEPDTSLVSRALRTGEISVCVDLAAGGSPVANREYLLKQGFRSLVALPLIVDGERLGALTLASRETNFLRDEELALLQEIKANLSFALQYRRQEDAIQRLAYFDSLTGLAKRGLFCERLDELLNASTGLALRTTVVAYDVDRLSTVNDTYGRHVGDLLLRRVA